MEHTNKQDEIDLLELFLKGVNIFRSNFLLIVVFFVLGTTLGISYYYFTTKIYESNLVISSAILTKSYAENLIDNLNRHRREMNTHAIASSLGISEKTATKVTHFKIENVSDVEALKESDRFIITVEILDPEILPELQKGLIHYLENNEFVKIRVDQNKSLYSQMIDKIDAEIKDMEAFKQKIVSGSFFQSAKGNVMFDPTSVNSKIIELTKEKITLQNNLALVNSVQVIEGFSKFEKPSSPKLSISIISGSSIGLLFVALLIAFKSIRRLLRMADAAKQNQ